MKLFSVIIFYLVALNSVDSQSEIRVIVDGSLPSHQINKHIYGHFSEHLGRCIYDGFWVSDTLNVPKKDRIRLDIVDALKKLKIPNLRWPGGCFADEYHWREGIGPRDQRPVKVNTNWGGVEESNAVGTHEFFDLAEMLGADTYVNGNLGTGSPQEMAE